jgi:twinkle protein
MYVSKDGTHVAATFDEMGIAIPYGKTGQFKTKCPVCKDNRKASNRNDDPLSVDLGEQIANCHNCGARFVVDKGGYLESSNQKKYKNPEPQETYDKLDERMIAWFESRKIQLDVLRRAKVTSGTVWMPQVDKEVNAVFFNYFDRDQLVNIKYRDGAKNFRMFGGAKLIFYNLNALYDTDGDIIIVEGEMDVLSYMQCDRSNVISVPNGASKGSLKLEYLDNHYHLFDNQWRAEHKLQPLKRIILATDDDEPGRRLRTEFVRRLGATRCWFVDFKGHNDPNEVLMKEGAVALQQTIDNCTPAPLADVVTINDLKDKLDTLHRDGLHPGDQIGSSEFQGHYSFEIPRMTIITGVSTHGKSEFLDDIIARLAVFKDWSFALFSPENFPIEYHVSKLVSKIIGKDFNECKPLELEQAYDFISKHFYWVYPEDNNYKLDNILRITDMLISRYGVNGLVIDPWTEIDKGGQHTTDNINEFLTELNIFKRERNCHIFLVAHPTKMPKKDDGSVMVPDLMNISGSANFFNKTDGGITVYRNFQTGRVDIFVNKVKFKHLGKLGEINMDYNPKNGRYEDANDDWDDSNWLSEGVQMDIFNQEPVKNDDIIVNEEFDTTGLDVPF